MENLRFFYSDKNLLETLKEKVFQENNSQISDAKAIFKIDFCMGVPLENLQQQAVDYFSLLYQKYQQSKIFDVLDYYDLLDAVFYLFASKYDFRKSIDNFKFLSDNIRTKDEKKPNSSLENYAKVYLLLISNFICEMNLTKNLS